MNYKIKINPSKFASLFFATALLLLWSCGGNSNEQQGDENETQTENTTADEQPVDDGQGVGKFKDITLGAINHDMAVKGKAVFEEKCYACHRVTSQKIVGPGLAGVTTKQKPAWILNMITNPVEMTHKDPTAKKLLEEHLTQMTFQDVSDEQAKEILEYLRENDANPAQAAN